MLIADSLCCAAETNTTLQSSYTPIPKNAYSLIVEYRACRAYVFGSNLYY